MGRRRRVALVLAVAMTHGACDATPGPPTTSAPSPSIDATQLPVDSIADPGTGPSPTPGPSAGTPVEGDLAGYWRVQESADAAAPVALVGSLGRQTFAVYRIEPTCGDEPCASLRVTVLLPSYSARIREYTLTRRGRRYATADTARDAGPCLTPGGASVPGGARISERTSIWLETVARAGTAVTTVELRGEIVLAGDPTASGDAAGCEPWATRYALSGSPTGAPQDGGVEPPPTIAPAAADLVPRPEIRLAVKGATVDWFPVTGRTVQGLLASVAAGGLKACGRISYEWYRGDTRPSGCMSTDWKTFKVIAAYQSGGACRLDVTRITAAYVVRLPRWTSPARVPAPLAKWWRATVTFIRDHEAGHVAIGLRWVKKLPGLLDGKACPKLESIMGSWAAGLQKAQEAYDADEYEAAWPPAPAGY